MLATAVHTRSDPDADVETGIRDWQAMGRNRFSTAATGKAIRDAGLSAEEAAIGRTVSRRAGHRLILQRALKDLTS